MWDCFQHRIKMKHQFDNKILSLVKYLKKEAKQCSGFSVEINHTHGYVNIYEDFNEENCVLLQGEEAKDFLHEVERLYSKVRIVDKDTIALALASPYIDNCLA
jgi:hypothetical protein